MKRLYTFLLQFVFLVSFTAVSYAEGFGDEEVVAFFENLEQSFLDRDFSGVVKYLHKEFFYIMTYSTDGKFSFLESDVKNYRKNVGSFFLSKPKIYDYSITVDNIQRFDKDIMVLIRVRSVVELYDIVNSCEASSNYHLLHVDNHFVVRDIRGDATCFNTSVDQ